MKKLLKIMIVPVALIAAGIYYYVTIPAVNIHASGFWFFLIGALAGITAVVALYKIIKTKLNVHFVTVKLHEFHAFVPIHINNTVNIIAEMLNVWSVLRLQ